MRGLCSLNVVPILRMLKIRPTYFLNTLHCTHTHLALFYTSYERAKSICEKLCCILFVLPEITASGKLNGLFVVKCRNVSSCKLNILQLKRASLFKLALLLLFLIKKLTWRKPCYSVVRMTAVSATNLCTFAVLEACRRH